MYTLSFSHSPAFAEEGRDSFWLQMCSTLERGKGPMCNCLIDSVADSAWYVLCPRMHGERSTVRDCACKTAGCRRVPKGIAEDLGYSCGLALVRGQGVNKRDKWCWGIFCRRVAADQRKKQKNWYRLIQPLFLLLKW